MTWQIIKKILKVDLRFNFGHPVSLLTICKLFCDIFDNICTRAEPSHNFGGQFYEKHNHEFSFSRIDVGVKEENSVSKIEYMFTIWAHWLRLRVWPPWPRGRAFHKLGRASRTSYNHAFTFFTCMFGNREDFLKIDLTHPHFWSRCLGVVK